jgi:hypothetical protein
VPAGAHTTDIPRGFRWNVGTGTVRRSAVESDLTGIMFTQQEIAYPEPPEFSPTSGDARTRPSPTTGGFDCEIRRYRAVELARDKGLTQRPQIAGTSRWSGLSYALCAGSALTSTR